MVTLKHPNLSSKFNGGRYWSRTSDLRDAMKEGLIISNPMDRSIIFTFLNDSIVASRTAAILPLGDPDQIPLGDFSLYITIRYSVWPAHQFQHLPVLCEM